MVPETLRSYSLESGVDKPKARASSRAVLCAVLK